MNRMLRAKRIPDIIRTTQLIIESDPINTAVAVPSNPDMQVLFTIHFTYIEPHSTGKDMHCHICLNRILTSFRAMYADLVELEKNYKLLQCLTD